MNSPTFKGTSEQQSLAAEIFNLMVVQGAMFAADAPIKQTLSNLVDFFAPRRDADRDTLAREIDTAICENAQVFVRQEENGEVTYITSRLGAYAPREDDTSHTFKERLYEPEVPLPVDDISVVVSTSRPALTTVEPVFISDYWQQQAGLLPMAPSAADGEQVDGEAVRRDAIAVDDMPVDGAPGGETPEGVDLPVDTVSGEEEQRELTAVELPPVELPPEEDILVEAAPREFPPSEPDLIESPLEEVVSIEDTLAETAGPPAEEVWVEAHKPVDETAEVMGDRGAKDTDFAGDAEAEVPDTTEEVASVARPVDPNVSTVFTLPDGTAIDLGLPVAELMRRHGKALEDALIEHIDQDPLQRIVRFGRTLYTEADKVNLGKNDLRRIREYIIEEGEPLLDTTIIDDLYHHSQRQSAYESFRFSLNYRLSREKDFEFVGVPGAYLWSTRGLPAIGTKRVKASEMGQLTAYLSDDFDDSLDVQGTESIEATGTVTHLLTFFEWEYGILPLDAALATLLPKPLLSEQRSVVLHFESPQHYTDFLVEVRYPTGNRGGWLQGFEDFFREHLVAGALVVLGRTDEPNVFTITYEEITPVDDRLLTLDEKKNKFSFANMTYYCAVDADRLLNQQRYGKLKNLKSLPMGERRKADTVLAHVFEVMGEQVGSREEPLYWLALDDLYVGYNVLRPASRSYLKSLLEAEEVYFEDEATPGAYYYKPEPEPSDEEEEEDDEFLLHEQYDDEEDY